MSGLCLRAESLMRREQRGNGTTMDGIDVSQWQGYIDFEAVARAGTELVYIKASEGIDFVDPFFHRNYANARNAGLPVGFYHYLTARSASAAKQEAYHFVSVTEGLMGEGRMVMDIEDLDGLTEEEVNVIAYAFLTGVEEFSNQSPAIYADAYNAAVVLDARLTAWPLWIAQYGVAKPDMDNPWGTWAGWQYTDKGRVPGIQGYTDRDIFEEQMLGSRAQPVRRQGERPPYEVTQVPYTVNHRDTVHRIAQKYHLKPEEITAANGLEDSGQIQPGRQLKLPIRDDRKQSDTWQIYRGRAGDTLYSIAERFETTVSELVEFNGIVSPSLIYPGQLFKIQPKIRKAMSGAGAAAMRNE